MRRRYRLRVALLLALATGVIGALASTQWVIGALRRVEAVEGERDRWQRPEDVIRSLALGEGMAVVDLGSGVGYFALKLAERVGDSGRVLAVDVRRFPLAFLRLRAVLRARRNIEFVRGEPDDPHLPPGTIDAVLVANTFHELEDEASILGRVREALRPGGRLVVVDPAPDVAETGGRGPRAHRHESPGSAEARLRRAGFEIASRDDRFIEGGGHGSWWLIVARRP